MTEQDPEMIRRRRLVDDLAELDLNKGSLKAMEAHVKRLERPFREWLDEHPDDPIIDQEHNLWAHLKPGGESTVYDVPAAIEARAPQLYRRLVELGIIVSSIDKDRIEKAIADGLLQASDMRPFRSVISRSPSFWVEPLEKP